MAANMHPPGRAGNGNAPGDLTVAGRVFHSLTNGCGANQVVQQKSPVPWSGLQVSDESVSSGVSVPSQE